MLEKTGRIADPTQMKFLAVVLLLTTPLFAAVGDPQIKTDHPWYPGELSCSTFERLFKTQAEAYKRVTGRDVTSDEDKAIASWYWRNLHYAHGEEGKCDLFAQGFAKSDSNRDYWTGLFAHGFGLCGTTHAQYCAELEALLGHCRGRVVGVTGHNSFEVFLTGGEYAAGRWALLDHDLSTIIFAPDGSRLLSIAEIIPQLKTLKDPHYKPERQRGWRVAGLHDDDAGVYDSFRSVEYLAGYAGPPPMVHLRKGESLRRYFRPGLEDGKTFVFWGMNYKEDGIPGLARSRTWVNQPESMHGSQTGSGYKAGQARFANALFTYRPNFSDGTYKEAVVEETADSVTFEFHSPYVIACTPPNDKPWGIHDSGARNGLTISLWDSNCRVSISTDQGTTWHTPRAELSLRRSSRLPDGAVEHHERWLIDATDYVKGHQQYWLRFGGSPAELARSGLTISTVCQANIATIPHMHDGDNRIIYASSAQAIVSAGPNLAQPEPPHIVDGKMNSSSVTLELHPPRDEKAVHLYAASWQASGNPPALADYHIDYSTDAGATWQSMVKDWANTHRPPEPNDFWSQSFTWGDIAFAPTAGPIRVRFANDGNKTYRKVEAHLGYAVSNPSPVDVTFAWTESGGPEKTVTHQYPAGIINEDATWMIQAGKDVQTKWVEMSAK